MYVMHVEMNTLNTRVQKQKENSSFLKLTFIKEGIKVVLTNVTIVLFIKTTWIYHPNHFYMNGSAWYTISP